MKTPVITTALLAMSLVFVPSGVLGQGRMLEPPGRSSMWRLGYDTPVNHNDNVLTCGGVQHRWMTNEGKCGVCGDPWDKQPRENEAGGKYASGIISGVFTSGGVIDITIEIAVANGGYFEFRLCANNNFLKPVSQKCLDDGLLTLHGTNASRYANVTDGINSVTVSIPEGLRCEQCVLQWKYRTADHYSCDVNTNNEQVCGFGHGSIQTEYYACADISIVSEHDNVKAKSSFGVPMPIDNTGNMPEPSKARSKRVKRMIMNPDGTIPPGVNNVIPYIVPLHNLDHIRFKGMPPPTQNFNAPRPPLQWGWNTISSQRVPPGRIRRRVQVAPTRRRTAMQSSANMRRFQNGVFLSQGKGQMFPGGIPIPRATSGGVQQQIARPMTAVEDGMMFTSTMIRPEVRDTFVPDVSVRSITNRVLTKQLVTKCMECPFDQCLDQALDLAKIFPGMFVQPRKFLECKNYEKLYDLGKYDVVKDGVPECTVTHPRFKRQIPRRMEDDDVGCCSTRSQIILPLTVQSGNDSFSVVQLPDDRKQLLVQGLCGRNATSSCPMCIADFNFQWVLVYDPRVDTNPPVSFVPVKFQHYCKCLNPGLRTIG